MWTLLSGGRGLTARWRSMPLLGKQVPAATFELGVRPPLRWTSSSHRRISLSLISPKSHDTLHGRSLFPLDPQLTRSSQYVDDGLSILRQFSTSISRRIPISKPTEPTPDSPEKKDDLNDEAVTLPDGKEPTHKIKKESVPELLRSGRAHSLEELLAAEGLGQVEDAGPPKSVRMIRFVEFVRHPEYKGPEMYFVRRERALTKGELAEESEVKLRDLRPLTSEVHLHRDRLLAQFLVRKKSIIVQLEPLQAIITHDRVQFFNVESALVKKAMKGFAHRMRKSTSSNFFEFRALETLLIETVEHLESEYRFLVFPQLNSLLKSIVADQSPEQQRVLLQLSQRLGSFESRVREISNALRDKLSSDEDMAAMYLTEKHRGIYRPREDHNDVEELFETFQHSVTEIDTRIDNLKQRIVNTEEYIKIHFDSQRNKLIRFNLTVSMATLSVAITSLVPAAFGMNLVTGLEAHPTAFPIAIGCAAALGVSAYSATYYLYRLTKATLSSMFYSRPSSTPSSTARSSTPPSGLSGVVRTDGFGDLFEESPYSMPGGANSSGRAVEESGGMSNYDEMRLSDQDKIGGRARELWEYQQQQHDVNRRSPHDMINHIIIKHNMKANLHSNTNTTNNVTKAAGVPNRDHTQNEKAPNF
eukprot:TRINITY_DN282_c0_g1_i1.p1 TRINITY_DN282_c0_g1~~TRINITY_DN282_c0_g1_i1.p1  ORF type:complete len:644 (+),score=95.02 TRINITY_DN282_c0_g1_i1:84-2015(+)